MLRLSRLAQLGVAVAAAAAAGGCTSSGTSGPVTTTSKVPAHLSHLRSDLPSGFVAPGTAAPLGAPAVLPVAPAANLDPAQLRLAPFPSRSGAQAVVAALVNQPLPLVVRPLFLSTTHLEAGGQVTVAATHLAAGGPHAALFVLSGPGTWAEHLVGVAGRVSAGIVTLPAHLASGTWYIVVEDRSEIRTSASGKLSGTILVDVAELHVG